VLASVVLIAFSFQVGIPSSILHCRFSVTVVALFLSSAVSKRRTSALNLVPRDSFLTCELEERPWKRGCSIQGISLRTAWRPVLPLRAVARETKEFSVTMSVTEVNIETCYSFQYTLHTSVSICCLPRTEYI